MMGRLTTKLITIQRIKDRDWAFRGGKVKVNLTLCFFIS